MSHRKVHSQGSVPFSWEDSPGVSKVTHQDYPANIVLNALNLTPPSTSLPSCSDTSEFSLHDMKIPLPPCPAQPLRRSTSSRGFWGQDDPFLAAYKECTKVVGNATKSTQSKKGFGFGRWKCRFMFSCKHSCEVEDDSLVRLTHLPPLPKQRARIPGLR